jgi:hypothetical protein
MIENKYITFETNDIIEALEDLYKKRTGETISIPFDDSNTQGLRRFKGLTVKKSISSAKASIEGIPNVLEMGYEDSMEATMDESPTSPGVFSSGMVRKGY